MADPLTPDNLSSLTPGSYAVIGDPVAHSLSPPMQQAALDACGLPQRYTAIHVPPDQLPDAVQRFRQLPLAGWNATLPHKFQLLGLVDRLDESARCLRTVNTVLNDHGTLTGFNTDGPGFVRAVREAFGLDVRDLRILILGAGGAGSALARQAARERCPRLVIANRTPATATDLARELAASFSHDTRLQGATDALRAVPWEDDALARELDTIDLIVNATSLGLQPTDPSPLPPRLLQPHHSLFDTVYRPGGTRWIHEARQAGARACDGLTLLLHQGALSFEIWTGRPAPLPAMRAALKAATSPA